MDAHSLIVYIKTKDIYSDIALDLETRFDTSNSKSERPLTSEKKKSNQINKK